MNTYTVSVPVELTFVIEASYSPGRPATPPTYSSGGDPPEPAEWDIESLSDITFTHRKYNLEKKAYDNIEISLLNAIPLDRRVIVADAIIHAICNTKLDEQFAEAVSDEVQSHD